MGDWVWDMVGDEVICEDDAGESSEDWEREDWAGEGAETVFVAGRGHSGSAAAVCR